MSTVLAGILTVAGLVIAVVGIYIGYLIARHFFRRSPDKAKVDAIHDKVVGPGARLVPLVGWPEFYSGQLKGDRLKSPYVSLRREEEEQGRDVLKELRDAQATDADIVALCGGGGFGKSRLLVELSKDDPELRFANIGACTQDLRGLMTALAAVLKRGQWFVVDDLQKYPGLGRLLGDLLFQTKARLLVACRDPDEVKELIGDERFKTVVTGLGRMLNVADVVRATGKQAAKIWDISHGIPALAELAARYGDLTQIATGWDLLNSITNDMAAKFKDNGRGVLAEISIRVSVPEDEEPVRANLEAVLKIVEMGYALTGKVGDRVFYKLDPDIIGEFITKEVYFPSGAPSPALQGVLEHMPMCDMPYVLAMLVTLYRGYRVERAAEASRLLLDCLMARPEMKGQTEKPRIGFATSPQPQTPATGEWAAMLIDMVVTAWDAFHRAGVTEQLLQSVQPPALELGETRLMTVLGEALHEAGMYVLAEPLMKRALAIDEKSYGQDHPRVAIDLNDLAQTYKATNRLAEAEPLMKRALAIAEKAYGPDHPDVATGLNNLAQLYEATNRLAEAEPLMKRALAIDEKSYGPMHPDVARDLNNLARHFQDTNRLAEAEPLMKRALAIDEKSYGPEHPNVAIRLNNLAALYQATNRLAEAEPLMKRALAIDEKSYGPDHRSVAMCLGNLAMVYQALNRLAEAEPLLERALAIFERALGTDHPDFATALNDLAALYQATNRLAEAEPLLRRALQIYEQSYDEEHPHVATALSNLAVLLKSTNRMVEGEPLVKRALAIYEKSYGPDHRSVAMCLSNLAALYHALNRLTEAEPLMKRALAIDEKSYGPDHPDVARDLNNLARLYQALNRLAEAEPLSRRQLEIFLKFTRATGHRHPHLQDAVDNYAGLLQDMGRSEDEVQRLLTELASRYGLKLD